MGVVLTILLTVLVLVGVVVLVLFVGFRRRSPRALDAMRWMTKYVFNPIQVRTAGRPGAFAGIVEHRGRVSGTTYRTPVGIRPTDDGFVIALPYDTRPDWVKNVLASGMATLTYEDETYDVDRPEVLPITWGTPFFTEKEQRKMGAITRCLRLRTANAG
jgi:hypothetical protein